MTVMKVDVKFPCGYEYHVFVKSIGVEKIKHGMDISKCPLHGKKCRRK